MEQVEKVTGLIRRGGTWSLRRRVPTDLVEVLGKREIWEALGTSDKKEAAKRARVASVRLDLEWDKQREAWKQGVKLAPAAGKVSEGELRRAVIHRFWAHEQVAAKPLPDDELRGELVDEIEGLQARDPSAESALFSQAKSVITASGLKIALPVETRIGLKAEPFAGSPDLSKLIELLRRADIERLERVVDRIDGQHGDEAHDPLFEGVSTVSPPLAAVSEPEGVTLGEAIKRFQSDPARAHYGDTADAEYLVPLRAMVELMGEDKPVAAIKRPDCIAVRDLVHGLPSNVSKIKAYKDCKTLAETVALAKTRTDRKLSIGTVRVYTVALSSFFNWMIDQGMLTTSPAQRLAPKKSNIEREKRPFSIDALNKIVAGLGKWSDNGALPGRWWVPLIAIYTGMRLGEIVSFKAEDIGIRDGVECFILQKKQGRSLKTPGAERIFPVHPELVRLGLLQRVATVKAEGGSKLFPDIDGSTQKEMSKTFQKRFQYWHRSTLGISEEDTSFHSTRHNFRDATREGGLPSDAIKALGGWARAGGVEERYGQGLRPKTLARWIAEVRYDGLVLPKAGPEAESSK